MSDNELKFSYVPGIIRKSERFELEPESNFQKYQRLIMCLN